MKYCSLQDVFQYRWDQMLAVFWQRYPNPFSKHVLSEDVVERKVVGNKLFSKRILMKTNRVPKWAERFVPGTRQVCVVEESIIDLGTRTIVTYTRNIGSQKILTVAEKCIYSDNPNDTDTCLCERQAWSSSGLYGFSNLISSFGIQRFRKNAYKAVLGYNHVLSCNYPSESASTVTDSSNKNKIRNKVTDLAKTGAEKAKLKMPRPVQTSCESGN